MTPERRRHVRRPAEAGTICTLRDVPRAGRDGDPGNLAVRLLDLASSGACLVTTGRLPIATPVILDVTLPGSPGPFNTRAEVRWSVTVENGDRTAHVAGLRFDRVLGSSGDPGRLPEAGRSLPSREPQRRWKRFSPRVASLSCDAHDLRRMLGWRSNPALSLRDLSRGGAGIVTSRKLKKGSRADLAIDLSVVGGVWIETQVRWCRRDTLSLEPRWQTGLVFIRMSKQDEARLEDAEQFHKGPSIW